MTLKYGEISFNIMTTLLCGGRVERGVLCGQCDGMGLPTVNDPDWRVGVRLGLIRLG